MSDSHSRRTTIQQVEYCASVAWFIALSNSNVLESISFGIWLGAGLVLLPSRLVEFQGLARSSAFLLFTALCLLRPASVAWSDSEVALLSQWTRFMLLPIMLWPLRKQWKPLLGGFLGGACASAAILAIRNIGTNGFRSYMDLTTHGKDIGMMCACFAQAFGLLVSLGSALWCRRTIVRIAAAIAIVAGMLLCGQRSAVLASGAALGASVLLLIPCGALRRGQWWRQLAPVTLGLVCLVALVVANPRSRDLASRWLTVWQAPTPLLGDEGLADDRGPLLRGALIIWRDHPWFGAGAASFETEFGLLCNESSDRLGLTPERAKGFIGLTTCHNGLADELACRGLAGGLLLIALMLSIARSSCRRTGTTALGVGLAVWLAFSMTDAVTLRGTHLAILAVLVTAAAALSDPASNESVPTTSSLPT